MKASKRGLQACPICEGNIEEDAWEDIEEQENSGLVIDSYPAYVCENNCGYMKKIKYVPNLFQFATSELSQDAFFCWLFEHVRLHHDDIAQSVAIDLLEKIILEYITFNPDSTLEKMKNYDLIDVEQQVNHIDILLTMESIRYNEKVYIVIEDKINSGENRKNQPEYYAEKLKKKDPKAVIIPVLLKTGYTTEEQQREYEKRKVVFIGHQDIYNLFTPHLHRLNEQVILQTWWQNFHENYYRPIKEAESLVIDPHSTLRKFNRLCRAQGYPNKLTFQVITSYLFGDIKELPSKHYRVQGKGHADWHFEIQNPQWKNKNKKIHLSLNLIWDQQNYSYVIKTNPMPYKSKNRLNETEKKEYTDLQKLIKSEIKGIKLDGWKITNYYLTIAKMMHIQDISLGKLKKKMEDDVKQLSDKFDEIMR